MGMKNRTRNYAKINLILFGVIIGLALCNLFQYHGLDKNFDVSLILDDIYQRLRVSVNSSFVSSSEDDDDLTFVDELSRNVEETDTIDNDSSVATPLDHKVTLLSMKNHHSNENHDVDDNDVEGTDTNNNDSSVTPSDHKVTVDALSNESNENNDVDDNDVEETDANNDNSVTTPSDQKVWKVYLWYKGILGGYRERLYNEEGWSTHPSTTLVGDPDESDIVVWISTMGRVEAEIPPSNYSNVIVLDYADGCTDHPQRESLQHEIGYFKRSFVLREHGVFISNCSSGTLPFAYSGIQKVLSDQPLPPYGQRPIDIINVLRTGGYHNENRKIIVQWTKEYVQSRSLPDSSYQIGEVSASYSASDFDQNLMSELRKSKIIVTCNPAPWEGDFRLWEAMLSGALVFVDQMEILNWMPYPLVNGKHFVVYNSSNQANFNELLDYYRSNPTVSERIAGEGYKYVQEHHMPKNRIDYILQNVQVKEKEDSSTTDASNEMLTLPSNNRVLKVHLWYEGVLGGLKERLYNEEGWMTHPSTTIVDSADEADVVVWISTRGRTETEVPPSDYPNVILLDYADGCILHQNRSALKHEIGYFKRSFVQRNDGLYRSNCTSRTGKKTYPFAYSGIQSLLAEEPLQPFMKRPIDIVNVLRTHGHHNMNRKKIVEWTKHYVNSHNLSTTSYYIGNVGRGCSACPFDSEYMEQLRKSKIIVTCNPNQWEGDFRLWEAMLSGALVFVDQMKILDWMPNPLVNGTHFVIYDSSNQAQFNELLDYYRSNPLVSKRIAEAGYKYVLEHHMPKNRVDYILERVEIK